MPLVDIAIDIQKHTSVTEIVLLSRKPILSLFFNVFWRWQNISSMDFLVGEAGLYRGRFLQFFRKEIRFFGID